MTDKEALAQDWKNIGDDMRVALEIKKYNTPKVDGFGAFLDGILSLNPFETTVDNNRCKHR